MALVVQKYGGTSVGDIARIKAVATHIGATVKTGKKVIAVVSAMGEHTDQLLDLAMQVSKDPPARELDMLLTAGERISMSLLSIALHDLKVSSLSLTGSQSGILTDACHGNARIRKVLGDRIRQGLEKVQVVIVAGFQGMNPETKEITTLGRGGTDLTAVAVAQCLRADACEIYKDVDGICTADPNIVKAARVIPQMHWNSLLETTWCGAAVLHARAAHLAKKFAIPLEIRSSFFLERRGTVISGDKKVESVIISSLTHKKNQTLIRAVAKTKTPNLLFGKAVSWLWERGESPIICQQDLSEDGDLILRQVISTKCSDAYKAFLKELVTKDGGQLKRVDHHDGLTSISVIGEGFWQSPETVTKIFEAVGQAPVLAESKNTAVTLCVRDGADDVLRRLHQVFFEGDPSRSG